MTCPSWYVRAVDAQERAAVARRQQVEAACDELLAGAGLTRYEDVAFRAGEAREAVKRADEGGMQADQLDRGGGSPLFE